MPSKKWLSIQEIAPLFHRPIVDVAATLGVCTTVLKKVCRRHGIRRWPQRKLQSLNKLINNLHNAMKSTDVVEEHQRLACEIANLQTRKAILTAPIVRSGGVMEPSHEELLAQQQDPSGGADPLGHAHMVAEHARIQLREGGTVNSPRAGGGSARRDDDGDSEADEEGMGAEGAGGAQATQDDGSTVALLMKMRANTSTGSTPIITPLSALGSRSNAGSCGASPNDPTPPTVSASTCGERRITAHAAGGWGATDRIGGIGGMPVRRVATLGGGVGAMPDPLSRIAKSNGLQRAASCSPKGTPFAGLAPVAASRMHQQQPYLDMTVGAGVTSPYMNMNAAELQLALSRGMLGQQAAAMPGRAVAAGSGVAHPTGTQVQQLMHEHLNLQMMLRMQGGMQGGLPVSAALPMPASVSSQISSQISAAQISSQLAGAQLAGAQMAGAQMAGAGARQVPTAAVVGQQAQPAHAVHGVMLGGKPSYAFAAPGWPSPTQASPLASPLQMPGGSVPASPQLQLQLQQLQQQMLQQQMNQQAQQMQQTQLKQQAQMQHLQLALQQQQQLLGQSHHNHNGHQAHQGHPGHQAPPLLGGMGHSPLLRGVVASVASGLSSGLYGQPRSQPRSQPRLQPVKLPPSCGCRVGPLASGWRAVERRRRQSNVLGVSGPSTNQWRRR